MFAFRPGLALAASLALAAFAAPATAQEMPSVFSYQSQHNLGVNGCLDRAIRLGREMGRSVNSNNVGVHISRTGSSIAIVVRCDIPGYAVFIVGSSQRDRDAGDRELLDFRSRFDMSK